ncbi:MAG: exopolysaccharide biosynthesis ExoD family protein [Rickettsiales bacterium]|jgi:hypothetical protein|nr:exopolysaccharide biosynthesis ExoD family protein [Rickettsiales bacterium]
MKKPNPHANQRTSVVLQSFAQSAEGSQSTIGELKNALSDRVFGILMLIFALPNLVPIPIPGISIFFGVPLIFLSSQLFMGKTRPWFPRWLSDKSFSHSDLNKVFSHTLPYLIKVEKILKPRFTWLVQPPAESILAGLCLLMAILIALPIPFGNWLPAFAICLMSLAILEHDGLFAIFGIIASCISAVIVSSVVLAFIGAALYFIENVFA